MSAVVVFWEEWRVGLGFGFDDCWCSGVGKGSRV